MTEYIDKAELLRNLEQKIKADNERRMAVVDTDFIDLVNDATVIEDVVEVVRCKDCKYWEYDKRSYDRGYHFGECTCPHWEGSSVWDRHDTTIDDYCSQGERKEQE